jgi:hypothetical protein
MVAPVTSNAPVRSQTQTSSADAISDSSRRRTGSPSALNIGANSPAVAGARACADSGGQHAWTEVTSNTGRTDMRPS